MRQNRCNGPHRGLLVAGRICEKHLPVHHPPSNIEYLYSHPKHHMLHNFSAPSTDELRTLWHRGADPSDRAGGRLVRRGSESAGRPQQSSLLHTQRGCPAVLFFGGLARTQPGAELREGDGFVIVTTEA